MRIKGIAGWPTAMLGQLLIDQLALLRDEELLLLDSIGNETCVSTELCAACKLETCIFQIWAKTLRLERTL